MFERGLSQAVRDRLVASRPTEMAPPIPAHLQRFTANPIRPGRYRPGKAVAEAESEAEDEDDEEEQQQQQQQPRPLQRKPQARATQPARPQPIEDLEDDDEEGFVTEDEDEADGDATVSAPASKSAPSAVRSAQPAIQAQSIRPLPKQESEQEESEEESEAEEEEESEETSSSEEESPQRKFQRPTFIKKDARQKSVSEARELPASATPARDLSATTHQTDEIAARRLAEAESLIKSTIERDAAAKLAGKKSWDDDDDLPPEALVDDTDGLDPEAEHSAWRLRELHRLKRDREVMVAREKELEEVERRRNLSKEEREEEDRAFIEKQRGEKDATRGQANFLSKYHHKGAFFMDDENSERLAKRDLAGAKFADDVADKSVLPEYMRIRDMTKLGKKGRTRYTDLKGTDTGRFGEDVKRWRGSGYENRDGGSRDDLRGVDERFLPDDERRDGGPSASGANASAVGPRKERRKSRSRSQDDRDKSKDYRDRDTYRPRSRSRSRSQEPRRRRYSSTISRSRSPPHKSRRRRSPSPYLERDKRRRVET